jgi:phytol kinase
MPGLWRLCLVFAASVAWGTLWLGVAGWLKRRCKWRTGYTRKLFHFITFGSAAAVRAEVGQLGLYAFGAGVSVIIGIALLAGEGNLFYEAMAREKDAPRRSWFIIAPYLATGFGGLISTLCFGELAIIGFLVTGLGDAVGEPIGTRFGKHTYRAPCFGLDQATRSLEGSAAVFVVSSLAAAAALWLLPGVQIPTWLWCATPAIGLAACGVEAISPHGWDNFTMQVAPTGLVWALLAAA